MLGTLTLSNQSKMAMQKQKMSGIFKGIHPLVTAALPF